MPRASKWLPLFNDFVRDLRISSKELTTNDERGAPLILWDSQRRFLQQVAWGLDDGKRIFLCLKSRQLGCTTISLAIDVFWLAMHSNLTGALVSDSDKNRDKNRGQIERYVRSLPEGYFGEKFTIVKSNAKVTEFSNGSRLDYLVAGTRKKNVSWGEGEGYAFAHETEVANYGDPDGLASFEESFAQTNPSRLFLKESTAKGFNHWHDAYMSAKDDPTRVAFFLGWWASDMNRIERFDPRFAKFGRHVASGDERELVLMVRQHYHHQISPEQLAWIRWKNADSGGDPLLLQNQPWVEKQAFIMTGFSFFQVRIIAKDLDDIYNGDVTYKAYCYDFGADFFSIKLTRLTEEDDRERIELKVWEDPEPDAKYVIGCDPAFGRNEHKDKSAISVWKCYADRLIQVAEFATAQVEAKHCAWVLAHLAGAYRDCVVNLDLIGPGRIIMLEWEHLRGTFKAEMYHQQAREMQWEDAMDNARWYLYHRVDSSGGGYAKAFETTWRTKQEIMHQMRGEYVTRTLEIRSTGLLKEMAIVVQDGNEIGAPESHNPDCKDDRVFACALSVRAWLENWRPALMAEGYSYARAMELKERGANAITNRMNDQVYRFFKKKKDEAEMEPVGPANWREARGLL